MIGSASGESWRARSRVWEGDRRTRARRSGRDVMGVGLLEGLAGRALKWRRPPELMRRMPPLPHTVAEGASTSQGQLTMSDTETTTPQVTGLLHRPKRADARRNYEKL